MLHSCRTRSLLVATVVVAGACAPSVDRPAAVGEDSGNDDPGTASRDSAVPRVESFDVAVAAPDASRPAESDAAVAGEEIDAPPRTPDAPPPAPIDARSAPDALVSSPGCAGYRWCDDFESYALGSQPKARWSVATSGGTVAVDGTHAFSGTKAVKFATNDGASGRRAMITKSGAPVFPLPNNEVWGRMMVWLAASPTTLVHWDFLLGGGTIPGGNTSALYRCGGTTGKRLGCGYYAAKGSVQLSDCGSVTATTMPERRWVCMEWHFNGPKNTVEFWLDGKKVLSAAGKGQFCFGPNDYVSPTFSSMDVGWWQFQKSEIPIEMWLDDVVLDTKGQIGCPKQP